MLTAVKSFNLALAFLLELCLLAALAYWGYRSGSGLIGRIALSIGLPAAVIALWGAFLAPTSRLRLHQPWLLLAKVVLFGIAATLLYIAGRPGLAWALAALFAANSILVVAWEQS
jgi:hypothetical protein